MVVMKYKYISIIQIGVNISDSLTHLYFTSLFGDNGV